MIKAVIFDWDGVLNDSATAQYKSYLVVLEKFRLPRISFSDFRNLWDSNYREFEERIGITEEKRESGDKVWFEAYLTLTEGIGMFSEARDFLEKVKRDFKVGLATAGSLNRLTKEFKRYGLENFFDAVVTADDTKKLKPDPEALVVCAEKMKVEPKSCVYVGDARGDILAARNAGMISIAVPWGYHDYLILEDANPDHIADSFDHLYQIIKSLN